MRLRTTAAGTPFPTPGEYIIRVQAVAFGYRAYRFSVFNYLPQNLYLLGSCIPFPCAHLFLLGLHGYTLYGQSKFGKFSMSGTSIYRYHDTPPSDLYIDIDSFALTMKNIRTSITANTAYQNNINTNGTNLQTALNAAVVSSWSNGSTAKKLGVYVAGLLGDIVPMTSHDAEYVKGSGSTERSAFVEASNSWVPNEIPKATSLLDKLFYWTY
jgi:hypothetical protein